MLLFRIVANRWDLRESRIRQELNLVSRAERELLMELSETYDVV